MARSDAPDGHVLAPAERAFTIYDLLTHRAGFIVEPPGVKRGAQHRDIDMCLGYVDAHHH